MKPNELALEAIREFVINNRRIVCTEDIIRDYPFAAGTFVGIHLLDGSLRGCIGTISPNKKILGEEIIDNAISAATSDLRFEPLGAAELDQIKISVDILSVPVPIKNIAELDPIKYGIVVSTTDGRSGVLLPDLPGITTVSEQIEISLQKGRILPTERINIERFEVKRFE